MVQTLQGPAAESLGEDVVTYSIEISDVPPSLNTYLRLHWSAQQRLKQEWECYVRALVNEHGNRCPRPLERVELRAVLFFPVRRRRDSDNYGSTLWKFVFDGLVKAGIIPDDDATRCAGYPPRIMRADTPSTVITISEVIT